MYLLYAGFQFTTSGQVLKLTDVKKKLEARGSLSASKFGMLDGSLTRPGRAAMIPELRVTMRKECVTRVLSVTLIACRRVIFRTLEHEEAIHQR
jgi:hypothetical protein